MRTLALTCAAWLALLGPALAAVTPPEEPPPQAEALEEAIPRFWHIRLSLKGLGLLVTHGSYDPLSQDDMLSALDLSLEGELALGGGLVVGLQATYNHGLTEDTLFGLYSTTLEIHALQGTATVGYRLWDGLMLYGRGGIILAWAGVEILPSTLSNADLSPGWLALGGVELLLPRRWVEGWFHDVFTFGLALEAGYMSLGRFTLGSTVDTATLMDRHTVAMGEIQLAGFAMRAGLVLSF